MPLKVAEAQLFHLGEEEGLKSLTLLPNGDPVDPEVLDNFAFEIHSRYRERHGLEPIPGSPGSTLAPKKRTGRVVVPIGQ